MYFSPDKLTVDIVVTRADGTKEILSASGLFQNPIVEENDSTTHHLSEK